MRGARATVGLLALLGAAASSERVATAEEPPQLLEPESPESADIDRHHQALRELLLSEPQPLCGLIADPSFSPQWSVRIVRNASGQHEVRTTRLEAQLTDAMTSHLPRSMGGREGNQSTRLCKAAALEDLVGPPVEHFAELDAQTAKHVTGTCERVLRLARRLHTSPVGVDGTTYHAIHWVDGEPLSGRVWSPDESTIAGRFVRLEKALAGYARARRIHLPAARRTVMRAAQLVNERIAAFEARKDR